MTSLHPMESETFDLLQDMNLASYRLMVVDDEPQIRTMVLRAVGRQGFHCLEAPDGVAALEIMARTRIDLVITDINMPIMDGLDLTRNIRERFDTDVIIMTGFHHIFSYESVMVLGASDFIEKPVTPKELNLRVHRVLRERKILEERNRAEQENRRALEKLRKAIGDIIYAITKTIELRDPYTANHQRRAACLAEAIGKQMGLEPIRIEGLAMGGGHPRSGKNFHPHRDSHQARPPDRHRIRHDEDASPSGIRHLENHRISVASGRNRPSASRKAGRFRISGGTQGRRDSP